VVRTRRLYHEDPEQRSFDARVLEVRDVPGGGVAVVLDRTAFYPTGGGQPHDLGAIDGRPVLEVVEDGDLVLHRMDAAPGAETVTGEVDWERRLDHRQQHTGQHILSRALEDTAGAATVGFHLGRERCSIDLDREDLDEEAFDAAETLANRIVLEDLPVRTTWHDAPSEVEVPVRKEFAGTGRLRVIHIGAFDANPCCGTHCSRTGQVGPVKPLRWERKRGGTRLEFVCGGRALEDYARRHRALRAMALALTTEEFDVPARVEAVQADLKILRARLERTERELREAAVERLAGDAGRGILIHDAGDARATWLAPMATALAGRTGRRVALHSREDDGVRVALALPEGDGARAGDLLRAALAGVGGRGGGAERLAQGRVPEAGLGAALDTLQSI
jgi:alanyl-tRNA synthetase